MKFFILTVIFFTAACNAAEKSKQREHMPENTFRIQLNETPEEFINKAPEKYLNINRQPAGLNFYRVRFSLDEPGTVKPA